MTAVAMIFSFGRVGGGALLITLACKSPMGHAGGGAVLPRRGCRLKRPSLWRKKLGSSSAQVLIKQGAHRRWPEREGVNNAPGLDDTARNIALRRADQPPLKTISGANRRMHRCKLLILELSAIFRSPQQAK